MIQSDIYVYGNPYEQIFTNHRNFMRWYTMKTKPDTSNDIDNFIQYVRFYDELQIYDIKVLIKHKYIKKCNIYLIKRTLAQPYYQFNFKPIKDWKVKYNDNIHNAYLIFR